MAFILLLPVPASFLIQAMATFFHVSLTQTEDHRSSHFFI